MTTRTTAALERAIRVVKADRSALGDGELLDRFVAAGDQQAFTELVRRHTPMVLGVCRRALGHAQDAEDVCQATFLVLARKAAAGRWRSSIAGWLYTTARRIAANARLAARRRARREGRAAVAELVPATDRLTGRELMTALDEELERLPARYREPLVLCYLEGLTRDEAAARLGIPLGTVKVQLERGRKRLAEALTRRGCGLGASLLALAATSPAGASPPRLVEAVLASVSGSPPAAVAALAGGSLMSTLFNKPMLAALTVAAVLGIGLGMMQLAAAGRTAKERPARPLAATGRVKPPVVEDKDAIAYAGRVLGPDGKPFPGAKVHLTPAGGYLRRPAPSPVQATTGPDGRFRFTVPKAEYGDQYTVVVATAANHGPGWVQVPARGKRDDLTLRLVKDDVPITGQVIDLEGKPVAGATLTVQQINAAPGEDLGPWLAAARARKGQSLQLEQKYLSRYTIALAPQVTTDATGRFRLTGIGRHRLVRAQLDGPAIASQRLQILTRPGEPIQVTESEGRAEDRESPVITTYHPTFRYRPERVFFELFCPL